MSDIPVIGLYKKINETGLPKKERDQMEKFISAAVSREVRHFMSRLYSIFINRQKLKEASVVVNIETKWDQRSTEIITAIVKRVVEHFPNLAKETVLRACGDTIRAEVIANLRYEKVDIDKLLSDRTPPAVPGSTPPITIGAYPLRPRPVVLPQPRPQKKP